MIQDTISWGSFEGFARLEDLLELGFLGLERFDCLIDFLDLLLEVIEIPLEGTFLAASRGFELVPLMLGKVVLAGFRAGPEC